MADESETKSERMNLALTPTELAALKFIAQVHEPKYDGASNVLRDYSINDAVKFFRKASEIAASAPAA